MSSTSDRIDEINAEMKKINEAFVADDCATDFDYLVAYSDKIQVLADELFQIGNGILDKMEDKGKK